ncbi:MAG: 3-hydroxyacyl-CoA dehydrogenase NAD-binding domain-containing protein [Dongiaceae bacterium]
MTKAAVIGLGTMGPGIAATLSRAGLAVRAFDNDADRRGLARAGVAAASAILASLGMPDRSGGAAVEVSETLADCVAGADLVLETVPENLDLKIGVFQAIEEKVGADCILASDTSGIPITKIQERLAVPERVVGMHWSNPPHIIPMIEVIAGEKTSPDVVNWTVELIRSAGLLPVVVKRDVPGFVENRVLYALLRECIDLVENGVIDAKSLDTCVSWGVGYKLSVVGPMALLDMAGLDVYQAVGSYLNKELCDRSDVAEFITKRTADGRLGIKSGDGVFSYAGEQVGELRVERARRLVAVRKTLQESQ